MSLTLSHGPIAGTDTVCVCMFSLVRLCFACMYSMSSRTLNPAADNSNQEFDQHQSICFCRFVHSAFLARMAIWKCTVKPHLWKLIRLTVLFCLGKMLLQHLLEGEDIVDSEDDSSVIMLLTFQN